MSDAATEAATEERPRAKTREGIVDLLGTHAQDHDVAGVDDVLIGGQSLALGELRDKPLDTIG